MAHSKQHRTQKTVGTQHCVITNTTTTIIIIIGIISLESGKESPNSIHRGFMAWRENAGWAWSYQTLTSRTRVFAKRMGSSWGRVFITSISGLADLLFLMGDLEGDLSHPKTIWHIWCNTQHSWLQPSSASYENTREKAAHYPSTKNWKGCCPEDSGPLSGAMWMARLVYWCLPGHTSLIHVGFVYLVLVDHLQCT